MLWVHLAALVMLDYMYFLLDSQYFVTCPLNVLSTTCQSCSWFILDFDNRILLELVHDLSYFLKLGYALVMFGCLLKFLPSFAIYVIIFLIYAFFKKS